MLFPPFNRNSIIQHLAEYIGYRYHGYPIIVSHDDGLIQPDSSDWIRQAFLGVCDRYHLHHYHPIGACYATQQIHNSRSSHFETKTSGVAGLTKEIKTIRSNYVLSNT